MNKLNIEALGLQEMTKEEMRETRGGCIGCAIVDAIASAVKSWLHSK